MEGNWKDGRLHGNGTERRINNEVFEGTFNEGKRQGIGKLKWNDGAVYEGEWV